MSDELKLFYEDLEQDLMADGKWLKLFLAKTNRYLLDQRQ